jgi:outer membrane protein assembly factor BamA
MFSVLRAGTSFAGPASPGSIQRAQEILEEDRVLMERLGKGEKFYIKKIEVKGAFLVGHEQIRDIVDPFQRKWLTRKDIRMILEAIQELYKKNGHEDKLHAIAYKIKAETLRISVKELSS